MRVLFLIPKSNPPELKGSYSKAFKEFVSQCLNKNPKDVSLQYMLYLITLFHRMVCSNKVLGNL
jgi:hypothetical protein